MDEQRRILRKVTPLPERRREGQKTILRKVSPVLERRIEDNPQDRRQSTLSSG
jgi:hypothetical protein